MPLVHFEARPKVVQVPFLGFDGSKEMRAGGQ